MPFAKQMPGDLGCADSAHALRDAQSVPHGQLRACHTIGSVRATLPGFRVARSKRSVGV